MSDRSDIFFSIGEFAKLCGTTKDALFHYEHIGLLKPQRKANGYRQYSATDFFVVSIIQTLQMTGSSLEEIGAHLAHHDTEQTLALFREKKAQLADKRHQIEQMERFLAHNIAVTEQALAAVYDQPTVEWQQRETMLAVPLNAGEGDDIKSIAMRLGEHFDTCRRGGLMERFPLGSIIPRENVLIGSEEESHFTSRVSEDFAGQPLIIKPAGRYATVYHKGDYASFSQGYAILLQYIRKEGLAICGDCYIRDLVSYLASSVEANYVLQISVQVA